MAFEIIVHIIFVMKSNDKINLKSKNKHRLTMFKLGVTNNTEWNFLQYLIIHIYIYKYALSIISIQ